MNLVSHFDLERAFTGARKPLNAMLRTRFVSALCTPRGVDDYLALLDATWSVSEVRARVVRVQAEAGGATSLWLRPNENWKGFRPGQFVGLSVEIGGVRHTRCFSLSSAPEDGLPLRITIRTLAFGRIANWAATAARPGDCVALTQAMGDFVLPRPSPANVLFVSGGSGITPIVSMVRHLLASDYKGEIPILHYATAEPILGEELVRLARRHAQLRFVAVATRSVRAVHRHVSEAQLQWVAPGWERAETFVCGPAPLNAALGELFRERGLSDRLHVERFDGDALLPAASEAAPCRITFTKSGRVVTGHASASLLEQAESAGMRPPYGCRMGICHTCKCKKLSGVVRNRITGLESSAPDEEIQLCISSPRSDVALEM